MKKILIITFCLVSLSLLGNDGAYMASGNQLIPIQETQVSIAKEVLRITKINDNEVNVRVEYEFFNPGDPKTILMGFEAPSPSGDVDGRPVNGAHPYISGFSVRMNDRQLSWKPAIVNSENYYVNNKIESKTTEEVTGYDFDPNSPDFYYVYYFNANFLSGTNKIIHTYTCALSSSVMEKYSFDYILTAANRWANNQIDDFTLILDLGEKENFFINNSFFYDKKGWTIENGNQQAPQLGPFGQTIVSKFEIKSGKLIYREKNFHPKGELSIYASGRNIDYQHSLFDASEDVLLNKIEFDIANEKKQTVFRSKDEASHKILRNLPFAIRGYIFKTTAIQQYYESMPWYQAKEDYKANVTDLPLEEQGWLKAVHNSQWEK